MRRIAAALVALVPVIIAAQALTEPATAAPGMQIAAATVRDGGAATRGTVSPVDEPAPARGDCGVVEAAFAQVAPEMAIVGVRIAMRESKCCPNVRGGDIVDAACNVTGVTDYSHRSDAGLFQLNGVWHGPAGVLCLQRQLCGHAAITSLSILAQVEVFAWVAGRYGLCHWDAPDYCA
jgi:hypothetical protein